MPASDAALEIADLRKSYTTGLFRRSTHVALEGLTLRVERGEIFGYLGPNGSGKTTTLKLLMGIIFPDSGGGTILGFPLGDGASRQKAGYLPEHPYFYDYLTPLEYLNYVGQLFGMSRKARGDRAHNLLEQVGLVRSARTPMRRFSKGMLQRLGVAQALMNDPEILFLDEPMSGLDPIGRRAVADLILKLKAKGKTVFFSTHILSDAETLCDRVAVLRSGKLLDVGRLDSILQVNVNHVEIQCAGLGEAQMGGLGDGFRCLDAVGDRRRLAVDESNVDRLLAAIVGAGGRILTVHPVRQSLEEYFFKELQEEGGKWTWDD